MKAIQFNEYGGPDALRLVEIDLPQPGPGEVRIKVHSAGVNPSDWKRREGQYRAFEEIRFPTVLGVEAAGVVSAVGAEVQDVSIGDAIFGFGNATMAEEAILTHWARKPDRVAFEVATGLDFRRRNNSWKVDGASCPVLIGVKIPLVSVRT